MLMMLSEVKRHLTGMKELRFLLPNGSEVPSHFHVTEVGVISKHFIDCGGTVRQDQVVNFQLWQDSDEDHRLAPHKMLKIIELSERVLGIKDLEVEVEYQGETIGKYGLSTNEKGFVLTNQFTDCLAKDQCGVPNEKPRVKMSQVAAGTAPASSCAPGGSCC